jgi:hypothetical protein
MSGVIAENSWHKLLHSHLSYSRFKYKTISVVGESDGWWET